jgi:hypothetical protein
MTPRRRTILKVTLWTALAAPVVLLVLGAAILLSSGLWGPPLARREAVRRLAAATSRAELERAVAYLGAVFDLPGGDWVAISYTDSHAPIFWSEAVALDSAGRWYEGHAHFCGMLGDFPASLDSQRKSLEAERAARPGRWPPEPAPGDEMTNYLYHLAGIADAPDLATARAHLAALGFTPLRTRAVPKLGRLAGGPAAPARTP